MYLAGCLGANTSVDSISASKHILYKYTLCTYTAKTNYRNFETNIPRIGISGSQSQLPHSCVCVRFIHSHDRPACSAGGNLKTAPGSIRIAHRHLNVEIGAEAALFPEKEYINGIFVAV